MPAAPRSEARSTSAAIGEIAVAPVATGAHTVQLHRQCPNPARVFLTALEGALRHEGLRRTAWQAIATLGQYVDHACDGIRV